MEKDVVCGMQVDSTKAAGSSQHNGKTYYFCSTSCKTLSLDSSRRRWLQGNDRSSRN